MVVCQQSEHHRGRKGQRYLDPYRTSRHGQGKDNRSQAENYQDTEDVAAYDVADGDIGVGLDGCEYIDDKLRRGRPEGHDGQADDQVADLEDSGNGG